MESRKFGRDMVFGQSLHVPCPWKKKHLSIPIEMPTDKEFDPIALISKLRGGNTEDTPRSAKAGPASPRRSASAVEAINTNITATRSEPGSAGIKTSVQNKKSVSTPAKSSASLTSFDGGDAAKVGQSHKQPGPDGGMVYYSHKREMGDQEIREALEGEIVKLKSELGAVKKENKKLSTSKLKLEEELQNAKEKQSERLASLRGQIVSQQQKINELSAMAAINSPKNRSSVYNTDNNPLSGGKLNLNRHTAYDKNIVPLPPSVQEQKQINLKLQQSAARTQRDFMAPTFTELMRQSAQKNKDGAGSSETKNSVKYPSSNGSSSSSSSMKGNSSKVGARRPPSSIAGPNTSSGSSRGGHDLSSSVADLSLSGMSSKSGLNYKKKGASGSSARHSMHSSPHAGHATVDPFEDPPDTVNGTIGDFEGISTDLKDSDDGAGLHILESGRKGRSYSYFDDGKGNIQVDLRLG